MQDFELLPQAELKDCLLSLFSLIDTADDDAPERYLQALKQSVQVIEASQEMLDFFDKFLDKMDMGSSSLDAETIALWNTVPRKLQKLIGGKSVES